LLHRINVTTDAIDAPARSCRRKEYEQLRRMAQMQRHHCALPIKGAQGYGAAQSIRRLGPGSQ
jgi:hypothetical protein